MMTPRPTPSSAVNSAPSTAGASLDLLTPIAIAFGARLRQVVIWSSSAFFFASYFVVSMIRTRATGGQGGPTRELLDFLVLLSWSTAALGFRPAVAVHAATFTSLDHVRIRALYFTSTAASVGVALADMVVVTVGAGLVAFVEGVPQRSMGELGLFLASASALGLTISLQFELVTMFGKRSITLAVTALLALVTLRAAQAGLPTPASFLGWLVFPVSGLASASEEPLRLDLAARALLAGVTYDLALIALLLALPGNRARGQQ